MPQDGTIPPATTIQATINDVPYVDNTLIHWDTLTSTQSKTLWINNTGNHLVNVTFVPTGLDSGWSEIWTPNSTATPNTIFLQAGDTGVGPLTLTVPGNASAGLHPWSGYIDVT